MFGLEFLTVGILHLATSEAKVKGDIKSQIECVAKISPKINVLPTKSRVKYNLTKSKNDLERFDIDTISPYGTNSNAHVGGLMSGKIQLKQQTEFMQETYDHVGYGCVYIKSIDVKIHIDPTIYIANENKRGSCKYNEILNHEKKHVREDRLIVNKYSGLIAKDLKTALTTSGYSFGPYEISKIADVQKKLQSDLEGIVKNRHEQMNLERKKRQQAIDSLNEYERISKACR